MELTTKKFILSALSVSIILPLAIASTSDFNQDVHGNLRHLGERGTSVDVAGGSTLREDFISTMRSLQVEREMTVTCPDDKIGLVNDPVSSCLSGIGCTARDMSFVSCKLVPATTPPSTCFSCSCGDVVDMKIQCVVTNENSSNRAVAWILGKLSQQGQCDVDINEICDLGLCADSLTLPKDTPTTVTFGRIVPWKCGSTIALNNVILGSQPTNTACDTKTFKRCNDFGPHCRKVTTQPINAPLVVDKPLVACVGGKTLDQIVTYTIRGGTIDTGSTYRVSITCSDPSSTTYTPDTTITQPGTYTKRIGFCTGTVTVSVLDDSGCTTPVSHTSDQAPHCCFNDFTCKTLPETATSYTGCSATDGGNALLEFDDVYNVNPEACLPGTGGFIVDHTDSHDGDDVCAGIAVTRTYSTTPKNFFLQDDPQPNCIDSWTVIDDSAPLFDGVCASSLDDVTIDCATETVPKTTCMATDTCAGTLTAVTTCCYENNMLVRTYTASDDCGNSVSTTQNVVLGDTACSA